MRLRVSAEDRARVMEMIERAVASGSECPSNLDIAMAVGADSVSTGARVISVLEREGLIRAERFGKSRIVTIVATGRSTAGARHKPHWRLRANNVNAPKRPYRTPIRHHLANPDPRDVPPVIDRDPCPRCGVRADVGCGHTATRLSVRFP